MELRVYYNTPYVIQACITNHTMELKACITTYEMELHYHPIDGITGIYHNTPYGIQACITIHTMELQACIIPPLDGITVSPNLWNYRI